MSDYVLLTDSAGDLSPKLQEETGVDIIPMTFTVNGKEYKSYPDFREYPVKKFYEDLRGGVSVSTSALNEFEYAEVFEKYAKEGKDFIYLAFSSGLSSGCQHSMNVVKELSETYPNVRMTVVDSKCASLGQGLWVYLCAMKQKEGASYDELAAYAEDLALRICHEFTVDDLGQLKRGGRISATAAFFGSMLQIKPMLYVNPEGKLVAYDKVRGRKISLRKLADKIIEEATDKSETPIFIGHGDCEDEAQAVADMIKEKLPDKKFVIDYIGPIIGAHSGNKTLAIFTVSDNRGAERENK